MYPTASCTLPEPKRQRYTVNYFPAENAGYEMWSHYNGPRYQADMETARNLGFNTLRINLPAKNGYFDFSPPAEAQLANLIDFYNRSRSVGILIHLTLFDHWASYGLIRDSQLWSAAVLGALPDTSNIAVIEIQNETRYASAEVYRGGFDSGWPTDLPEYDEIGQVALVWSQRMMTYLRSLTTNVPLSSSCSHGTPDLMAYVVAVNNTPTAPDWYDWHCYTGSGSLVYSALKEALRIVGDPARLYIGEAGLMSTPSGHQGTLQAQQAQSDYIQAVRWSCAQLGLPEPSPWILFDIKSSLQFPNGQAFGLLDTSGNLKISGAMYKAIPPGETVPAVDLNGDMRGSHSDGDGNTLPIRWLLYRGQEDVQPIKSSIDYVNIYQGRPTVLLTGSSFTDGSDNPPALESRPYTWPIIYPGMNYTFSCELKATKSNASGVSPSLQISWYDASGNYVSSLNGPALALTSQFIRYSISNPAPADAAYARLFVRVGYNSGGIRVGGATWIGPQG